MSKYEPLASFLGRKTADAWHTGFEEIERILGFPLPESARRHAAWWANQRGGGHTQTAGWRDAGWRTAMLDLNAKRVTFERDKKRDRARTDVAANADFAVQGAIAHLNALGGTMPDYRPAPRDRPMA